jgi:hypothetical protein
MITVRSWASEGGSSLASFLQASASRSLSWLFSVLPQKPLRFSCIEVLHGVGRKGLFLLPCKGPVRVPPPLALFVAQSRAHLSLLASGLLPD